MKTPLCDICRALRNVLCKECERKLDAGLLSEADVAVVRALTSLEFSGTSNECTTQSLLDGVVVSRAVDLGTRMVIFSPEDKKDNVKNLRQELESLLKKKIIVLGVVSGRPLLGKAGRNALDELLSPVKLHTTRAFKNGRESEKIVIERAGLKQQGIDEKRLENLVKEFLEGIEVSFA